MMTAKSPGIRKDIGKESQADMPGKDSAAATRGKCSRKEVALVTELEID